MKNLIMSLFLLSGTLIAETPKWVNEPDKACKKSEICALGEGTGYNLASANARTALASIFETKIESKFSVKTISDNEELNESVSSDINEITEGVLNGVEITKRYEGKDSIYVLAVLDKRKAAKTLKKEIDEIDEQMKAYAKETSAKAAIELKRLFAKRGPIEARHQFLTNRSIKPPVSFEQIMNKRRQSIKGLVLYVNVDEESPKQLEPFIISTLVNMEFRVHRYENKATHSVKGSLKSSKEYMKVEGFEKFKFTISLFAQNKAGNKSGGIEHSVSAVGRDYTQALGKAIPILKDYLMENLGSLNIE